MVIYEKHKNVLQYKESECEDMYSDQLKPAAMPMRSSIIKSDHNRGGAHPNMQGHSRLSSSDLFLRSNDDTDDCKQKIVQFYSEKKDINIKLLLFFIINIIRDEIHKKDEYKK